MATVKAETFRANSSDELKKEQFNLRFRQASGELESPARMKSVRREIARIKTVLGEQTAASTKAEG